MHAFDLISTVYCRYPEGASYCKNWNYEHLSNLKLDSDMLTYV